MSCAARLVAAWWLCTALPGFLLAQATAPARAFVEVDAKANAWVQEPVLVTVTIGYDAAWFDEFAVQLFRQRLDVPFYVDVPWLLGAAERAVEVLEPPDGVDASRIAVGDRTVRALRLSDEQRSGRAFRRLQLSLRWLPLSAGEATIAPATLRYAYATKFTDDVLRGRQPVDRQEERVASPARRLLVQALPQPQPEGFGGAVGSFEVTATSGGEQVHVGETFQVELVVEGDGNLERFARLSPPALPGFHVQGVVERRVKGARVFTLDVLALRAGATTVPPIPFVSFSPGSGQYVTTMVPAVPVRVVPELDGVELPERVRELVRADQELLQKQQRWPWWAWFLMGMALVAIVRLLTLDLGKRRRRGHLQGQLVALRDAIGGDAKSVAMAFEQLLTAAGGTDAFEIQEVLSALHQRGAEGEVLARVQRVHGELDGARFGGPRPDGGEVVAVAEAVIGSL